jgi:platelet-activating factor acetylhydrolase IB subunit alpha
MYLRLYNSHKSILDYLRVNGLTEAFETLKVEAGQVRNTTPSTVSSSIPLMPWLHYIQADFAPDPKAKWAGLLEKKWTSVIRLQKKV